MAAVRIKIDDEINEIDFSHIACAPHWLYHPAGREHYKLLAAISYQLPPKSKIADLGTQFGSSSLALSSNPEVEVASYDILSSLPDYFKKPRNTTYSIYDITKDTSMYSNCSLVFLDIDPHDGEKEQQVLDLLLARSFSGLLICDDIHLNLGMKTFWHNVQQKKLDATKYGHWSGTGIIVFNPNVIDVDMKV